MTLHLHPQLSQLISLDSIPWPGNAAAKQELTIQKPHLETSELTTLVSVPDQMTMILDGLAEMRTDGDTVLIRSATTRPAQATGGKDKGWRPIFMLVKPTIIARQG